MALLLYAYVGATCAALAWGYTDDMPDKDWRGLLLAVAALWPVIVPVVLYMAWRDRAKLRRSRQR